MIAEDGLVVVLHEAAPTSLRAIGTGVPLRDHALRSNDPEIRPMFME